jgi:hypothetical protein
MVDDGIGVFSQDADKMEPFEASTVKQMMFT